MPELITSARVATSGWAASASTLPRRVGAAAGRIHQQLNKMSMNTPSGDSSNCLFRCSSMLAL
jgi:hypothetical protein